MSVDDPLSPSLRYRAREVFSQIAEEARFSLEPSGELLWRLECLYDDGIGWLELAPDLAEQGYALLAADRHHELRRWGCIWLTLFPSPETARRLAAVALDESTPKPVREQAVWSLGYRQARGAPPSVRWSEETLAIADAALIDLATQATEKGVIALEKLPLALRHVNDARLFEQLQRAPALWGDAYEAYASKALAEQLLERLDELKEQHQLRALRLAASTLGEAAVERLLARAKQVPTAERLELLYLGLTFAGERCLGAFEAEVSGLQFADGLKKRARWHLANPGVVPTVRALQAARTTGVIDGARRRDVCARAADDFAALATFARHPEHYLYELWAVMVNGAGDPERARVLAAADPESRSRVKALFLRDLAERGRVNQLAAAAHELRAIELSAYWLAVYGRPFAALELASASRSQLTHVVAARVLALYRAGRPDLAERVLSEEPPLAQPVERDKLPAYPGPHELWVKAHAADRAPVMAAVATGLDAVLALSRPAPKDAEPDATSLAVIRELERRLARPLFGATVFLAGTFADKAPLQKALEAKGCRIVAGPFSGTHYYVLGDSCPSEVVAQLERQGARRLARGELL